MKTLTLFFFFLIGMQNLWAGPLEVKLRALLSNENSCSVEGKDYTYYFETDEVVEGPKKIACDPDTDKFFKDIKVAHCWDRFGRDGQSCVVADPEVLKKRMANNELMNRMVDYSKKKFDNYKTTLIDECCGDKVRCRSRFSAVEFEPAPSEISQADLVSAGAAITTVPDRVRMTTAKIASAYNTENIDRVLLAELGHACQFALNSENPEQFAKFVMNRGCDKESGLIGFREGLGEEMASCLIKEVESQIEAMPVDQRGKFCFGKWYREVFSDMMFRKHYTSIYHWTYDMSRRTQSTNYASVDKYIRCGLPQELIQKVCK